MQHIVHSQLLYSPMKKRTYTTTPGHQCLRDSSQSQ